VEKCCGESYQNVNSAYTTESLRLSLNFVQVIVTFIRKEKMSLKCNVKGCDMALWVQRERRNSKWERNSRKWCHLRWAPRASLGQVRKGSALGVALEGNVSWSQDMKTAVGWTAIQKAWSSQGWGWKGKKGAGVKDLKGLVWEPKSDLCVSPYPSHDWTGCWLVDAV
jgi:hypothetical protein